MPKLPQLQLVELFILIEDDVHERYRTGQIVAQIDDDYLIQFDATDEMESPPPMELYTREELIACCSHCGQKRVNFFTNRVHLNTWLQFLQEPPKSEEKSKVVALRKADKDKVH